MKKVLFVCLGNICRSPTAQGVFEKLVEDHDLYDHIRVDSCGTGAHHAGERADIRMMKHAKDRGYKLRSIARGISPEDLDEYDYVITMDDSNYSNVLALANDGNRHKIQKMTDYCQQFDHTEVPDPYYGGPDGFELVIDLLEDACAQLLDRVKSDLAESSQ